ncbi:MRPL32 family protein [Megaselia abdita]
MIQLLRRIETFWTKLENLILFPKPYYVNQLQLDSLSGSDNPPADKFSLKSLIGDGFLFAVPKHRRSVERNLQRKFGNPEYVWKLLKVKSNLRVCHKCGSNYEVGLLCPSCYKKVFEETKLMQTEIENTLKLDPVDKEVIVLYKGEINSEENLEKKVVEMPKSKPLWFSKNLIQKTTKPTELNSKLKDIS